MAKVNVQLGYQKEKGNNKFWSCLNRILYAWEQPEEEFGKYAGKCGHRIGIGTS